MRYEARIIKSRVAKAETPIQLTVEQESVAGEWLDSPCDLREPSTPSICPSQRTSP